MRIGREIRQKRNLGGKITGRAKCEIRGESEMRKQFLAFLLPLLAVALITAAAQTQGAGMDAPRTPHCEA